MQKKSYLSTALLVFVLTAGAIGQASDAFPLEVLKGKASIVTLKSTPEGATVKVDGVIIPAPPFMLLRKDKPRVLRFELAGYKPIEKAVDPGRDYVIGISVDFVGHKAVLAEVEQTPNSTNAIPSVSPAPVVANTAASVLKPVNAPPTASPASSNATPNPFGFEFGMTKQQAIAKLGKDAVAKDLGIKIEYEFDGWDAFVDQLEKKSNSTF